MKILKFVSIISTTIILVSCGNNEPPPANIEQKKENVRENSLMQIKKYESEMHKSMELNQSTAALAITEYDNFAKLFPEDSLTPDFLFKAAEITTATQQYKQALAYYQRITSDYPKYKMYPESLYLQAFLLDNYLNDDAKAKTLYEEFISKYPDMSYANDAKAAINNLGKSDEELIKEFEKKNKGK